VDLFRCESIRLKTHWILVVMDQFSRRIVGVGVQAGAVDGAALCRMFNRAIVGEGVPRRLSSDHDPLFTFQRWQANLRVLGVEEIKTVPYLSAGLSPVYRAADRNHSARVSGSPAVLECGESRSEAGGLHRVLQ